jgi:hypothetical protein
VLILLHTQSRGIVGPRILKIQKKCKKQRFWKVIYFHAGIDFSEFDPSNFFDPQQRRRSKSCAE